MSWLQVLFTSQESIATSLLILSLVAALGIVIGSISIKGISLGIGGTIFSGIILGHFGLTINHTVLEFAREFGLVLFVYSVGLHVGPGILEALKSDGLKLNIFAIGVVCFGLMITAGIVLSGKVAAPIAVGIFSGATTNTPSLAASTQALTDKANTEFFDIEVAAQAAIQSSPKTAAGYQDVNALDASERKELLMLAARLPSVGYAVAYPFGVIGTILSMLIIRAWFRVNVEEEKARIESLQNSPKTFVSVANIRLTNSNLFGKTISQIPALSALSIVITRVLHNNNLSIASPQTVLHQDDVFTAVGHKDQLEQLQMIVGERSELDLREVPTDIALKRVVVTNKQAVGCTIGSISVLAELGVHATRIFRAGVEITATPNMVIHYADSILLLGMPESLKEAANFFGDIPRKLDHPDIIVLFLGIVLGVIVGSYPIAIPGVPVPVKLGMAGGPLLVAILLSRMRKIGPMVSYMPQSAKVILRELGILLFLSAVGLKCGDTFFPTLLEGDGLKWMLLGAIITMLPLLLMGYFGRKFLGIDYLTMSGVIAGSMTDPPALAFAQNSLNSDETVIGYAAVYPLTMIMRIVGAQLLALVLT